MQARLQTREDMLYSVNSSPDRSPTKPTRCCTGGIEKMMNYIWRSQNGHPYAAQHFRQKLFIHRCGCTFLEGQRRPLVNVRSKGPELRTRVGVSMQ